MTKDEALAALRTSLTTLQDACCYHADEYGSHYAPDCQDDIDTLEDIIDTVEGLHTSEFVVDWITKNDGELTATFWREEMGLTAQPAPASRGGG
jgi:GH43 family beta-xylosidase